MELTPAKFLALFLFLSVAARLIFIFAARLVSWILGRMIGAQIQFRFGGLNSLKDIAISFKRGVLESLIIGEVRLCTQRPSRQSQNNELARNCVLQILVYDAEVVLRENSKQKFQKGRHQKRRPSGRGKWMIFTNIAKYVTVSVAELLVQLPDWTFEVKELELGMNSDESSLSVLGMRLLLTTCNIHERENHTSEKSLSFGQRILTIGGLGSVSEVTSPVCAVEKLCVSSMFGHGREKGMMIKQTDVKFGDIIIDMNEGLLYKKLFASKKITETQPSKHPEEAVGERKSAEKGETHFLLNVPEKASLSMQRLLIKVSDKEKQCILENEVAEVQFNCAKVENVDEFGGPLCHLDIHVDLGEIHLLREANTSLMEVAKAAIVASLEISKEANMLQAEVDLKLGGAQCNLLPKKFERWLHLVHDIKAKHRSSSPSQNRQAKVSKKRIKWTSTISAPEMGVSVYDLDGIVQYNICLQTSHIFLNSTSGQNIGIHTELGELYVNTVDEKHNFHKSLFGVDTSTNCLFQLSRMLVDWEVDESDRGEHENEKNKVVLVVEVSGISMHLTLNRVQSLLSSSICILSHFKRILTKGQKHKTDKGSIRINGRPRNPEVKLMIEGISIQYGAEMLVTGMDVPDPKKVNFGSQLGEVVYQTNKDGTPRTASIKVAKFREIEGSNLVYKSSFDVAHLQVHLGSSKNDAQVDIKRFKGTYQELGPQMKTVTEITFASLQNGQIIYRMINAGNGLPDCLICVSDIRAHWEPDIHLFFLDAFTQMTSFWKKQEKIDSFTADRKSVGNESNVSGKGPKRTRTVALDVEQVYMSATLADGVDASLSVSSTFSEDFKVGILLEGLKVTLNGAAVLRSKRLQIARVPCFIQNKSENMSSQECSKCGTEIFSSWDYLIQGAGIHVVLPYRLECRAIDDAIEDTWRGLKLVMMANKMKTTGLSGQKSNLEKKSTTRSSIGAVKFSLESIIAEIEEEPLQGWLDEHHQLISKQKIELDVRERLLDELISESCRMATRQRTDSDNSCHTLCELDGDELDFSDPSVCKKLKDRLHIQGFEAYKKACKALHIYESSGSARSPFQSGFKPSTNRGSLMSIKASNLEVTLTDIEGGKLGMIKQIRKLDCVPSETEIPYSRVLGKQLNIKTSLLVVQIRNYTLPVFLGEGGKCKGQLIFARQATCFPNQIPQELYIGRWRKITMLRSESGTTPPFKMFSELPFEFEKAEVAYGVGFEPSLTDISYAFSVALKRADLSMHDLDDAQKTDNSFYQLSSHIKTRMSQAPKKERNLPWWDDMRYYIHGKNSLFSKQFKWAFLATTNPYEQKDMLKIESESMHIQQEEGSLSFLANNFKLSITSLENKVEHKQWIAIKEKQGCIQSPYFQLNINMDWDCETGKPLFHYLHAFPQEQVREKVFDPFRSTKLVLRWDFHLGDAASIEKFTSLSGESGNGSFRFKSAYSRKPSMHRYPKELRKMGNWLDIPTMSIAGHDLSWIFKWWSTLYSPPHKLRTFSKWPTFGLPRIPRSGNLSLDKVLTDFMLRVDSTPTKIRHISLSEDDPAEGLTFSMRRFKYELWYSRGAQEYKFDSKRDSLELVYQGLDLDKLKAELWRGSDMSNDCTTGKPESLSPRTSDAILSTRSTETSFFFTSEYFSLRKQAPKADSAQLLSWQEGACRASSRSTTEFPEDTVNDLSLSDASDGDEFIVLSDNCLRVSLHSLRLLWTISNRDAVWAWVEDIHRAFESPKPSPSRQYARSIKEKEKKTTKAESIFEEGSSSESVILQNREQQGASPSQQLSRSSPVRRSINSSDGGQGEIDDGMEEGTLHFLVYIVEPQFNLQSEDARGRFLLAAARGEVMARSIHSIMDVRPEMIAHTPKSGSEHLTGNVRELSWRRRELSVILKQVQAHVAPTDVDLGAGLQWLPKIPRGTQKVKRTGPLLETVFTPCEMCFQYTRCKSEATDIKVKALKELSFNSSSIAATMTSRQFQVMVHVISNLLLARLPKPRRNLSLHGMDEDNIEEVTDEVVPDGVPEVEHARMKLQESERGLKLLLADIKIIKQATFETGEVDRSLRDTRLWMMECGNRKLVGELKVDMDRKLNVRKMALMSLRMAKQRAAQQQFKEKEKSKSIPSAMRISWTIEKIVWNMISDGQTFAEAEISSMNLNVDRDFHEVGIAQFSAKHFVVKNCLRDAKSDTVLSAWNPPKDWERRLMLRVDAKQGAPKEGQSLLELFQVEVFPLRINFTERMFNMMWEYFFPKEEKDGQRRLDWERTTTAAVPRGRKVPATTGISASVSKLHTNQTQLRNDRPGVDLDFSEHKNKRDTPVTSSSDIIQAQSLPEIFEIDLQKKDVNPMSLSRNSIPLKDVDNGRQSCQPVVNRNENEYGKSRGGSRVNKLHKPLSSRDDKKLAKSRLPHTNLEIHNIKIAQVGLLITYEGSMFSANEKMFLIDTFTRSEFTGTWRKLFDEITKHVVWSICKSLVGAQRRKFKKQLQEEYPSSSSDSELKRPIDRAGEGFVSSVRVLFNSQRKKAKAVRSRLKHFDGEDTSESGWVEGIETDSSTLARQPSVNKVKRLLRRRTIKLLSNTRHRGSLIFKESAPMSPSLQSCEELSSDTSSRYEDFNDE